MAGDSGADTPAHVGESQFRPPAGERDREQLGGRNVAPRDEHASAQHPGRQHAVIAQDDAPARAHYRQNERRKEQHLERESKEHEGRSEAPLIDADLQYHQPEGHHGQRESDRESVARETRLGHVERSRIASGRGHLRSCGLAAPT
jgi:hypothetical protein